MQSFSISGPGGTEASDSLPHGPPMFLKPLQVSRCPAMSRSCHAILGQRKGVVGVRDEVTSSLWRAVTPLHDMSSQRNLDAYHSSGRVKPSHPAAMQRF